MWSVAPPTIEQALRAFDSDEILPTTLLVSILATIEGESKSGLIVHTLPLTLEYPALPDVLSSSQAIRHESRYLLDALHISRLTKTPGEVALMRKANEIGSNAHEVLMRTLGRFARRANRTDGRKERTGREGVDEWQVEGEADGEAVFVAACRRQG